MHGDHIGGLMAADGVTPFYPNARYVTGGAEHNHWSGQANEGFDKNVKPLNEKFTFLDDGGAVVSGITAMAAFGHTPGHMAYVVESGGERLAITADTANHYVWSLQFPDWEVRFDADKAAAAATRKALFGMIAADRIPFIGYHMPFPGMAMSNRRTRASASCPPAISRCCRAERRTAEKQKGALTGPPFHIVRSGPRQAASRPAISTSRFA